MARIPRSLALLAALGLAVTLSACQAPAGTTGDTAAHDPEDASTPTASPRTGWLVTAVTSLGTWVPEEICGGDYVFIEGVVLSLVDGSSVTPPTLQIEREGVMGVGATGAWTYFWDGNFNSVDPEWGAGALYQGGGPLPGFQDGRYPPEHITRSGDWVTVVDASLGTEEQSIGTLDLTFERIPEPEWCLEDEQYYVDNPDAHQEFAWHYYD